MSPTARLLVAGLVVACALPLATAAPADATTLVVRGAGFGHGVGMSQYGALGMAERGWSHRRILRHYYRGTRIGGASPRRRVRVLLGVSRVVRFTRATRAGGRRLTPGKTYRARARDGGRVDLLSPTGRRLRTVRAPLRIRGAPTVTIRGRGRYRGVVSLRRTGRRLQIVNALGVEDYVRAVVPLEVPPTWPAAALRAQAIAARTYALTTAKGRSRHWDHYRDVRSQVYGGAGVETRATDRAVRATRGDVVTYAGRPVVTFFFSTSGGRTENVELALGGPARPWLRSVRDPFDAVSPVHRWRITMTFAQARRRLKGLVRGRLRGIAVVRRGRSPRVIEADVVGSRGRVRVSGHTLRERLRLHDTWASFSRRR